MQSYEELKNEKSTLAERLAYIDFKLQYTGFVKRAELGDMFNIAEAASSKALSEYIERYKSNIEYDASQKVNVISRATFKPLIHWDAEVALGMLANGFNKNKLPNSTDALVPYDKIDKFPNKLSSECVAKVTRAIAGGYAVQCKYLSDNSENHDFRTLVPLSIMHDGVTWMFRAYHRGDSKKIYFKNFHFSRMREIVELNDSVEGKRRQEEALSEDKHWNLKIPLELRLHPNLEPKTKNLIRWDFGMEEDANEVMVPIRSSFLWILTRKWLIDDRDEHQKSLDKKDKLNRFYKFELLNRETVEFFKNSI